MKKTISILVAVSFALAACGSKNKNNGTTPKADSSGSMGGATYAKPGAPTTPAPPTPTTTATPNPCGAGM